MGLPHWSQDLVRVGGPHTPVRKQLSLLTVVLPESAGGDLSCHLLQQSGQSLSVSLVQEVGRGLLGEVLLRFFVFFDRTVAGAGMAPLRGPMAPHADFAHCQLGLPHSLVALCSKTAYSRLSQPGWECWSSRAEVPGAAEPVGSGCPDKVLQTGLTRQHCFLPVLGRCLCLWLIGCLLPVSLRGLPCTCQCPDLYL